MAESTTMRRTVIGVDAAALAPRRTGVGNYIANLLKGLLDIAGGARFVLYANAPIAIADLPGVEVRIASPNGRRGVHWQNTQLGPALVADPPTLFWGGNGFLPVIRPRRMRTVVTVHDLVYRFAGDTLPAVSRLSRRFFQPYAVSAADRVVAVSAATADDMARAYGRGADAIIHPIVNSGYGPVAAAEVERVRARHSLPADYLLTLGTLEPRKNLIALVRAMALLADRGVASPPLVIAGGRGWLDGDLTRAIEAGEAAGVVRRLGFVDDADMPGLYAGARFFLLASLYEGFGMPILEAQLCGVRILASDIASLREASGGHGVFFAPAAEAIARCLTAVLADPASVPQRPLDTIDNDPTAAARRMWSVMQTLL